MPARERWSRSLPGLRSCSGHQLSDVAAFRKAIETALDGLQ
jgi:hypothetical protein